MKLAACGALVAVALCALNIPSHGEKDFAAQAERLAAKYIITDGHIDTPYRLHDNWADISKRTEKGQFDYERARAGGLDAPFMSIYIPAKLQTEGGSKALADELIDMVQGIANDHPDKFAMAASPSEVEKNFEKGIVALTYLYDELAS